MLCFVSFGINDCKDGDGRHVQEETRIDGGRDGLKIVKGRAAKFLSGRFQV